MGLFGRRKSHDGNQAIVEQSFDVSSSGFDESPNGELARKVLGAVGVAVVIHGPNSALSLSEYISASWPRLVGPLQNGCVSLQYHRLSLLCFMFDGPKGAAYVVAEATLDEETDVGLFMEITPLGDLNVDSPWSFDLVTQGTTSNGALAERLSEGVVVAPSFAATRDPGLRSAQIISELVEGGWSRVPETAQMVGVNVDIRGERTQVVFGGVVGKLFRLESGIAYGLDRSEYVESIVRDGTLKLENGYSFVPANQENGRGMMRLEFGLDGVQGAAQITKLALDMAGRCDSLEAQLWGDDHL